MLGCEDEDTCVAVEQVSCVCVRTVVGLHKPATP
jgi:hypothetical protein